MLATFLTFFACVWLSSGTIITVLMKTDQGLSSALLDPANGTISCPSPITLPPTQGTWDFGSGTRGQTSAVFPMNQTYFYLAQENFPNGTVGRTILIQGFGPFGQPGRCYGGGRAEIRALLPTQRPLSTLNTAWDHTCNIVVLIPTVGADSHSIVTKQISEYDGQVRPQADYLPPTSGAWWTKVDGLGALDFGDYHTNWNPGAEWNCGNLCTFYTLEQSPVDGPRAFIGKSFRTGKLALNLTDELQLQTLSWSPYGRAWVNQPKTSQFVGIGVCCSADWCSAECQGLEGHSVLALFDANTKKFSVLADIGDGVDPDSVRMGVEFSGIYAKEKQAFVYYQGAVVTFALNVDQSGAILGAKQTNVSPQIQTLQYWFGGRGMN